MQGTLQMQLNLLHLLLTEWTSTAAAPRGTRESLVWDLYILALFSDAKRRSQLCPISRPLPSFQLLAIWSRVSILDGVLGTRPDLSMELYLHKEIIFMLQISIPSPLTHTHAHTHAHTHMHTHNTHTGGQWLRAMVLI